MNRISQKFVRGAIAVALIACLARYASAAVSFSGDTSIGTSTVIGNMSFGTFRIDGGSVHTTASGGGTTIGAQTNSFGIATVTGAGSQWNFTSAGPLTVGSSGMGRLEVLDGGSVNFPQFGSVSVASNFSSHGTVIVDGPGSLLNASGLTLGNGIAALQVSNGGIVNLYNSGLNTSLVSQITLDGGLVRAPGITHNGTLSGSGELQISTSSLTNNGRIEAGPGDSLKIAGANSLVQNQGVIAADGATIEFHGPVTTNSGSPEVTLRDSLFRAGTSVTGTSQPQFTNMGVLAATGGLNDFYGRVLNQNNGRIAITNNSAMIFHDDVTAASGTIVVFPGSSAVFLEDLQVDEGATLLADLAGTNEDSGFGQIEVVGNAILAGALSVTLDDGYTPRIGDSFPLLAASSISGDLALGNSPALPAGMTWDLDVESHRVVLSVVPTPDGDYDQNGVVDALDYVVWRMAESSGALNSQDYDFWRNGYGNSIDGQSASAAVPETTSVASLCMATLLLTIRRWERS